MNAPGDGRRSLHTPAGEFPLHEYHLRLAGRAWAILHTGGVLSREDESRFLGELRERLPYGVALWPAAIALAHEVASRADAFRDRRVLELRGRHGAARHRRRLARRARGPDRPRRAGAVRLPAQWRAQRRPDDRIPPGGLGRVGRPRALRLDPRLGHPLRRDDAPPPAPDLRGQPRPRGRVLLTDPFRAASLPLLEALEADGWAVSLSKWSVGRGGHARHRTLRARATPVTRAPRARRASHTAPAGTGGTACGPRRLPPALSWRDGMACAQSAMGRAGGATISERASDGRDARSDRTVAGGDRGGRRRAGRCGGRSVALSRSAPRRGPNSTRRPSASSRTSRTRRCGGWPPGRSGPRPTPPATSRAAASPASSPGPRPGGLPRPVAGTRHRCSGTLWISDERAEMGWRGPPVRA